MVQLQEGDTYQWARKGRQGAELLVVLRRVMRTARDWRVPVWVVKLDIRKAFDSVWQESMGQLVDARVGRLLASGGTAMGGQPWEARAWLGLLEAREMRVAMGDLITSIPQSNGVRQGSPGQSSPVCSHHCHVPRRSMRSWDAPPDTCRRKTQPPPNRGLSWTTPTEP